MYDFPKIEHIRTASRRIEPFAHRTPVLTCSTLDHMVGAKLYFKCENFQKVGAFKFRGACNAVMSLSNAEAVKGVATHSSGNHAQALALAARIRDIEAHIVMPENSPEVKKAAVVGYGADITFCEPTLEARERILASVLSRTGATFVHPYNDYQVISGQATATLELLEDTPNLDIVITPVGGGGLLSGTALAISYLSPGTKVIAGEPREADDAFRSLQAGYIIPSVDPQTIADALLPSLGDKTFAIIQKHVHEIITVSEDAINFAMHTICERMKILVEPSSAVALAALFESGVPKNTKRIGIILTGGNVDLERLSW